MRNQVLSFVLVAIGVVGVASPAAAQLRFDARGRVVKDTPIAAPVAQSYALGHRDLVPSGVYGEQTADTGSDRVGKRVGGRLNNRIGQRVAGDPQNWTPLAANVIPDPRDRFDKREATYDRGTIVGPREIR